ncbi:hypothetical protein BD626DRAFT_521282 [Schizophyllum amplum]|uniref:Uncharacterized protein n=1 Tax=Schizophyllum amplum TaxID=97359 RepID=A0A550BTS9_9AGAR|nr:hypothetical protein BD626DRAFT_521282 [Auriculariopsis ampla]
MVVCRLLYASVVAFRVDGPVPMDDMRAHVWHGWWRRTTPIVEILIRAFMRVGRNGRGFGGLCERTVRVRSAGVPLDARFDCLSSDATNHWHLQRRTQRRSSSCQVFDVRVIQRPGRDHVRWYHDRLRIYKLRQTAHFQDTRMQRCGRFARIL